MFKKVDRKANRKARHARVRKKVEGTSSRPRLNIFRSGKYIYAQIIDDSQGHTLAAASSQDKSLGLESTKNIEAAKAVGTEIAKKAKDQGIDQVVFDRSGYIYHGRIKALAEAARENGLDF